MKTGEFWKNILYPDLYIFILVFLSELNDTLMIFKEVEILDLRANGNKLQRIYFDDYLDARNIKLNFKCKIIKKISPFSYAVY